MEKLPADVTAVESRVQVDGNAITSRGAGTGMEFSLALTSSRMNSRKKLPLSERRKVNAARVLTGESG